MTERMKRKTIISLLNLSIEAQMVDLVYPYTTAKASNFEQFCQHDDINKLVNE